MFVLDRTTTGPWVEATSFDLLLVRDSSATTMSLMPRQLRVLGSRFDASGDNYLYTPIYIRGPWSTQQLEVRNSRFTRTDGVRVAAIAAGSPPVRLTLGADASWAGDRLVASASNQAARLWLHGAWEGAIVVAGSSPGFGAYGVIRKISASADKSAIHTDIDWLAGARPSSGTLTVELLHELLIDDSSRYEGSVVWTDTRAMKQVVPAAISAGGNRPFPSAYPAALYGF